MPGGDSGGCFVAGTKVLCAVADGDWFWKNIEDLKVDDSVLAYDENYKLTPNTVTHVHKHENNKVINVQYWGGQITCTPTHWVVTTLSDERGTAFLPIGKLQVGDGLVNETGKIVPITKIVDVAEPATVYNLTVEPLHTYVCGNGAVSELNPEGEIRTGICVHNMPGGGDSGGKEATSTTSSPFMDLMELANERYQQLYKDIYWPIEEGLGKLYLEQLGDYSPYASNRFRELIALAEETNPILDANKKDLIRRLTEGEDVLSDRYRSEASNDIASSFAQQRQQMQDKAAQMGISPTSGAFASGLQRMGTDEALAAAQARTSASRQAEDESIERMKYANDKLYTTPELGAAPTPGLGMNNLVAASAATGETTTETGGGGGGKGLF